MILRTFTTTLFWKSLLIFGLTGTTTTIALTTKLDNKGGGQQQRQGPTPISELFSLGKVYLRNTNDMSNNSPWCYVATIDPTKEPPTDIQYNFLATQVWPSARAASFFLERNLKTIQEWTVCELGCGPGLPALTLAKLGLPRVIATDLDPYALQMVQEAAQEQGLDHILSTQVMDLTSKSATRDIQTMIQDAHIDLFIMSDVFENADVAKGAAKITFQALKEGSKVWTFAQSDRAQREIYLQELYQSLGRTQEYYAAGDNLKWNRCDDFNPDNICDHPLILFDLDEITVDYG